MPLVTIEVADSVPATIRFAYAEAINAGLVEGLGMDAEDRFQVIHPLPADHLVADANYLGGTRRNVIYIRILMVRMYDAETKSRMFDAVARNLEAEGVRPDDVFIAITENKLEDWYPGARGERGDG